MSDRFTHRPRLRRCYGSWFIITSPTARRSSRILYDAALRWCRRMNGS